MNIITKKKRSATSVRKGKEGGKYIGGKKNPPMIINWLICWSEVLIFPKLADLPDMLFKISDFDKYKRNNKGNWTYWIL